MNKKDLNKICNSLGKGNFSVLSKDIFSELDLREIAEMMQNRAKNSGFVFDLINSIPIQGREYDWNAGSIIQHFDTRSVIDALSRIQDPRLYNSIGLSWVLGEFRNTDRIITDFLYNILKKSLDSDAWWRAAFSLEKLGLDEAVSLLKMSLKNTVIKNLDYHLANLHDKRSVVSVLVLSNVDNIEHEIYPKIKSTFINSIDTRVVINCCWLIGRLKLIDKEIYEKLVSLIYHKDYELKYYTFFALQNNATELLRPILEKTLSDKDPLIKKMAVRGLLSVGNEQSLTILQNTLAEETEDSVISELTRAIYGLKNPHSRERLLMEVRTYRNENGMISDESDKWYRDPSIYHLFSEAEDPENICFDLINSKLRGRKLKNPIDLATGTGRMIWQIMEKTEFQGDIIAVDASQQMCDFVAKTVRREHRYTRKIKIVNSTIEDLPKKVSRNYSNFIISSFGFPSRISNEELCIKELKSIYKILSNDGLFFTIGWDETFNDELNRMWFNYIPDQIVAEDFEGWRRKRADSVKSPRNCNLKWMKKSLQVPLQFPTLQESVQVMGYLFGRDAASYIIKNGKAEWTMSLGITCNTKIEIANIIKRYERNRNTNRSKK